MSDATPITPPPIEPDAKDWTWVLDSTCPECGFDARAFPRENVGAMLRANAVEWVAILGGDARDVRRRSEAEVWSPLEYAAHVRDVCRIYDERLRLMLNEDGPRYPNWDQDATALRDRYHESDPAAVAAAITEAAEALAARFDGVTGDQWERTGFRSDGASFTVESFGRYFIHDPIHHLHDVAATGR